MGDREDKLSKAREKLEKFRKKKQKLHEPIKVSEEIQSNASSTSSPLTFLEVKNPEPQLPPPAVSEPTTGVIESIAASVQEVSVSSDASPPPASSLSSYFGVPSSGSSPSVFEQISTSSNAAAAVPVENSGNGVDIRPIYSQSDAPSIAETSTVVEDQSTFNQTFVSSFFSDQTTPSYPDPQTLGPGLSSQILPSNSDNIQPSQPFIPAPGNNQGSGQPSLLNSVSSNVAKMHEEQVVEEVSTSLLEPEQPCPADEETNPLTEPAVPASDMTTNTTTTNTTPTTSPALPESGLAESEVLQEYNSSDAAEVGQGETESESPSEEFRDISDAVIETGSEIVIVTDQAKVELPPEPIDEMNVATEIISEVVHNEAMINLSSGSVASDTNRGSLDQLSSQIVSELSFENDDKVLVSQINTNSQVLELQDRNQELVVLLDEARQVNKNSAEELELVKKQLAELQNTTHDDRIAAELELSEENSKLKSELSAQAQAIKLLVSQKNEVELSNSNIKQENEFLLKEKLSLQGSVDDLESVCKDLRAQVVSDGVNSEMLESLKLETEKEICGLRESLMEKEISYHELQSKLSKVSAENSSSQAELAQACSELEMCKVHLTQLRGSGAQNILNDKEAEIEALNHELGLTRKNLVEAVGRVEHLAGEREQLAEQYRNYSRDLASQAERLSEQLRKFQDENARLVHREACLVQNVGSLESQVQAFRTEGKNVTEEEIFRLKDQVLSCEEELRMSRDEKEKMEEMLMERGNQVDEMGQRLAVRDTKIMELQGMVSRLETSVEMLKSTSRCDDTNQAQLLAANQSDKVAASMAMQQNVSLKARLEELQGALVTLTNTKAELLDKLEAANRTISNCDNIQAEITARDEAVKEKEILLTNMRNQVRYLEEELGRRKTPDSAEIENINANHIKIEENEEFINNLEKELYEARDMIRNLNSQNSELRSKLEVLSSNSRACSESRCDSSSEGRVDMADTSLSDSSDSFVELDGVKKSSSPSSDSFVNVEPLHQNFQENDFESRSQTQDVTSVEQTVIRTVDLPFLPSQDLSTSQTNSSVDNFESVKQLENRFMAAMEQLAELSSDKEQLEHLVERLQEETETIGDYVIMYQHQRKMQKIKIQEKEEQVIQLAKDRAELLTKLTQLQKLVTKLVDDPEEEVVLATEETLAEVADTKAPTPEKVSDKMASSMEKEKILELINEIGTGSSQIMARCENFEPWFWETSPSKVMTV